MKKIFFFAIAVSIYSTVSATPRSKPLSKADFEKHFSKQTNPDPCIVTVTQTASAWAVDCDGTTHLIRESGTCTKTAENCYEAYVAARDCAQSLVKDKVKEAVKKISCT